MALKHIIYHGSQYQCAVSHLSRQPVLTQPCAVVQLLAREWQAHNWHAMECSLIDRVHATRSHECNLQGARGHKQSQGRQVNTA